MSAAPPLSHHEILLRAGPFAARGWHVDLAASDRDARQIAFRPRALEGPDGAIPARLVLDLSGRPRLRRTLRAVDELEASLEAEGDDVPALLARIEAVPAARQRFAQAGARGALQLRLDAAGTPVLREALVALDAGLRLRLRVGGVGGFPAELALEPGADGAPLPAALPSDLLAVLGRRWSRLARVGGRWQGHVAVRGHGAARGAAAEALLAEAAAHLARTFAEPPARFHARHRGARWAVVLREMLPTAVGLGIVALALLLQHLGPAHLPMLGLLANVAPPLLMGLFFLRREMPHIGLPRVPRPPSGGAWR